MGSGTLFKFPEFLGSTMYHLQFPLQLMFTVYSFQLFTHNLLYHSVQYFNTTTEASGTKNQAVTTNVREFCYTKTKQS